MYGKTENTFSFIKRWLIITLIVSIISEMIFFPSLNNFLGCLMAVIVLWGFLTLFKKEYIINFPFSLVLFVSMFLYRFLPLTATLLEGKPVTYGFEVPFQTFLYETIAFLISCLAFRLACRKKSENNFLQRTLYKSNFFESDVYVLWGLGLIGLGARMYIFGAGDTEFGDVGGKFVSGIRYLMYAPITLLFPKLLNIKSAVNRRWIWFYIVFIFVLNISSNSREAIITPIAVFVLLFFLNMVKSGKHITDVLSPGKLVLTVLFVVVGLNLLSDLSLAMLTTRALRKDISKVELFQETIKVYQNDALMDMLRKERDEILGGQDDVQAYNSGWTETYVTNFMLARYANMRISDETIYLAQKVGYSNEKMQDFFVNNVEVLFPTPVLRMLGIDVNKNLYTYSRADLLYALGTNTAVFTGFRVTSHVGDGLATFGYFYFPLQFLFSFLIFKLLNTFVYFSETGIRYAPFALMNLFTFLGMFRNSNGFVLDLSYIIRGYIQGVITYLIIFLVLRKILNILKIRKA